jgi:hypothetical protein
MDATVIRSLKHRLLFSTVLASTVLSSLLTASVTQADELAGEWTLSIETPRGLQHPTLVITRDGDNYTGIYNSMRGPLEIDAISRDGDKFAFPLVITVPIGDIEVNYRGTIAGDDMTGQVENPRGTVPFTGKRTAP